MQAIDICQIHLDDVSSAMLAGDFGRYVKLMTLPLHLIADTGTHVVANEADLRRVFETYAEILRIQHFTELIRLAESAVQLQPGLISCYYETNILQRGHRLVAPFRSHMFVRNVDGVWQTAMIANSFFLYLLSKQPSGLADGA